MGNTRHVNVEVVVKDSGSKFENTVQQSVLKYLKSECIAPGRILSTFPNDPVLKDFVNYIIIENIPNFQEDYIDFSICKIHWHIYSVDNSLPMTQNEYCSDGEINIATHLVLPNVDLVRAWENLHYESDIKENLLRYAHAMMKFADRRIDGNIITCNKVILLHGPPGTGKTSLCKALAHKLSVRMQDRYSSGLIIEINSHSLFSKYFSESGKLVNKMFSSIKDVIENSNTLVCVLIDEVESLAHARDQCLSGVEPSDSIRVVNAVLTQIDQIKRYHNVLILATSNLTKSIDLAFIDRADIKQFLGLPSVTAIYKIYCSCIEELQRIDILEKSSVFEPSTSVTTMDYNNLNQISRKLLELCEKSCGFSGRALRKIPFIAYALFSASNSNNVEEFFISMEKAIEKEKSDRTYI
ncbi:hypothetical protein WA026_017064 [Henosepilachna vigintioctopunctata]|uniref:AAA+ ATPase domain-containing protein n=1 Tax=Henosepilachna vigintioctopunctata TaxID=420089 RepID=A0AAW1TUA9_9CUCU